MKRFIAFFVLFFHIFPFIIVNGSALAILYLTSLWLSLFLGLNIKSILKKTSGKARCDLRIICDRISQINVKFGWYLFFLGIYIFCRSEYASQTFLSLINFSYTDLALDRAIERYSEISKHSVFEQISTICFFCISFIFGASVNKYNKFLVAFCAIIQIILFFIESSSLARTGVLLACVLASFPLLFNNREKILRSDISTIIYLCAGFLLSLILIFSFSTVLRIGMENISSDIFIEKLHSYTLAMYSAFYSSFESYIQDNYSFGWGYNTFTFIFKLFNVPVQRGFYEPVLSEYGLTNIFTLYRGLIFDFPLILNVTLFFIFGYSIGNLDSSNVNRINLILGAFSFCVLSYFLYSPFYFSTFFCGFCLSMMIFQTNFRKIS